VRKIGEQKARHLLLTGEIIKAQEALNRGLITSLVERNDLESTVYQFAQTLINSNSEQSMQLTKQLIQDVQTLPLKEALDMAATMNAHARATEDCKKGISAFLNKQDLRW
jgi:methylglutaconyl-CoA hydratase